MKDKRQDIEAELSDIAPLLSKLKEGAILRQNYRISLHYFQS